MEGDLEDEILYRFMLEMERPDDDRVLSPEEFRALIEAPMSPEERDRKVEMIRLFMRRYPTPAARLGFVRRMFPPSVRK